jgi:hypothetical protein
MKNLKLHISDKLEYLVQLANLAYDDFDDGVYDGCLVLLDEVNVLSSSLIEIIENNEGDLSND